MKTSVSEGQSRRSNGSANPRTNESNAFPQVSPKERNGSRVSRVYACARACARVDPCTHCSHWETGVGRVRNTHSDLQKHGLPMGAIKGAPIGAFGYRASGAFRAVERYRSSVKSRSAITTVSALPCEGGFRCHCPRGHAPAVVRISFRPADGSAACLRLLCAGCAATMEAALSSRGTITRRSL
jgi:hypothetical protein